MKFAFGERPSMEDFSVNNNYFRKLWVDQPGEGELWRNVFCQLKFSRPCQAPTFLMHHENRQNKYLILHPDLPHCSYGSLTRPSPQISPFLQLAAEKNCVACTYNLPSAQADGGPGCPWMRLVNSHTLGWAPNSHCILLSYTNVFFFSNGSGRCSQILRVL